MTESFEHAVARILEQIPHAPDCNAVVDGWQRVMEEASGERGASWHCSCDRPERRAAAVARAIQVAWGGFWGDGRGSEDDVLRALEEGR